MEELERTVDALVHSTTEPFSGSRVKKMMRLVETAVLDDTHHVEVRYALHRILDHVGADHSKVQPAILQLLLNNDSSLSMEIVTILLDCIALSYHNDDDGRFDRTVAGKLVALCEDDRRCTLPVLRCLSQFPSCRRRCIDFILLPVLEEDTLGLIQLVVPLVQTTEEAVTVLELIAEEASCCGDMTRVLDLASIVCTAWQQAGETIATTYTKSIVQDGALSALDVILLLQFPVHGEEIFRDSVEKNVFPFQLAEEALKAVPENHPTLQFDGLRWMLFFLSTLSNDIGNDERSHLPVSFLLGLYQHQTKAYRGSSKRDGLLMLLHFSDAVIDTQHIVYKFFLHLYQTETKDVRSLWPHLVDRILQTPPPHYDDADVDDNPPRTDGDLMLCRNVSLLLRDNSELTVELDGLMQKLLFSTPTLVVRGIQLVICCLELEFKLPAQWHEWIVRILTPPSRRTIDPLIGSIGLIYLEKSATMLRTQADAFQAIKMMIANAGLIQSHDNRRVNDERWTLGYEDLPTNVSFGGRRMLFSHQSMLHQLSSLSDPSRLVPTVLWIHGLLYDYIRLGCRDVPSWRPDGWMLASIEFPEARPSVRVSKRLLTWIETHLSSFDFYPSRPVFDDELVLELEKLFRKDSNIQVLYDFMLGYAVGLLAGLAMSTAVARNVLSDLAALPEEAVVLAQLFKLFDLMEKVNRVELFLSNAIVVLEQYQPKVQQQHREKNMDDSSDSHDGSEDEIVSASWRVRRLVGLTTFQVRQYRQLHTSTVQAKERLWNNSVCLSLETSWALAISTSESVLPSLLESTSYHSFNDHTLRGLYLMDRLTDEACKSIGNTTDQLEFKLPASNILELAIQLLTFLSTTNSGHDSTEHRGFTFASNITRCCLRQTCVWIKSQPSEHEVANLVRKAAGKRLPPTQSTKLLFDDLAKQLTEYVVYPVFDSTIELLSCFTEMDSGKGLKGEVLHLSWSNLCSAISRNEASTAPYYSCSWTMSSAISYLVNICQRTTEPAEGEHDGDACRSIVSTFLAKAQKRGIRESRVFFVFRLSLLRHWGLLMEAQNSGVDSAPHIGRIATALDLHFVATTQDMDEDSQTQHEEGTIEKSILGFINPDATKQRNIFLQLLHGYVLGVHVIEFQHPSSYGALTAMLGGFRAVVHLVLEQDHPFRRNSNAAFIQVCSDMLRITVHTARRMVSTEQPVEVLRPVFEEINTSLLGTTDRILAEWTEQTEESPSSGAMTGRMQALLQWLHDCRHTMTDIAASIDNKAHRPKTTAVANDGNDVADFEDMDDDDYSFGAAGDWGRDSGSVSTRSTGLLNLETTMMMQN